MPSEEEDLDGFTPDIGGGNDVVDGFAGPTDEPEVGEADGKSFGKAKTPAQGIDEVDDEVRDEDERSGGPDLAEGVEDFIEAGPMEVEGEQGESGDEEEPLQPAFHGVFTGERWVLAWMARAMIQKA